MICSNCGFSFDGMHICSIRVDSVTAPSHYTYSKIEAIDAIEAWQLDFLLGNTIKYVVRAGKKDPNKIVEDLEKAAWYLNRKISKLKGSK